MNKIEKLMSLREKLPSKQVQFTSSLSNMMIINNIVDATAKRFMDSNVVIIKEMIMSCNE